MDSTLEWLPWVTPVVEHYESCKLVAYLCPANVWTIGYGHTKGVKEGDRITVEQADAYLEEDLKVAAKVLADLPSLRPWQAAAVVDFTFNLGAGAFRSSTLRKLIVARRFDLVPEAFKAWVKLRKGGVLLPAKGLCRRRCADALLWEGEDFDPKLAEQAGDALFAELTK